MKSYYEWKTEQDILNQLYGEDAEGIGQSLGSGAGWIRDAFGNLLKGFGGGWGGASQEDQAITGLSQMIKKKIEDIDKLPPAVKMPLSQTVVPQLQQYLGTMENLKKIMVATNKQMQTVAKQAGQGEQPPAPGQQPTGPGNTQATGGPQAPVPQQNMA